VKDLKFIQYQAGNSAVVAEVNDLLPENGDVAYVEGHDRKLQDLVKILATAIGSNPVFITYGSDLPTVVGKPAIDIPDQIRESILAAVSFLVEMETSPLPAEQIGSIQNLTVKKDGNNPEQYFVNLTVVLNDGTELQLARRL
jgi:hypothetical protein